MLRPYDFSEVRQTDDPSVVRVAVEAVEAINLAEEKINHLRELGGHIPALSVPAERLADLADSVVELGKREAK